MTGQFTPRAYPQCRPIDYGLWPLMADLKRGHLNLEVRFYICLGSCGGLVGYSLNAHQRETRRLLIEIGRLWRFPGRHVTCHKRELTASCKCDRQRHHTACDTRQPLSSSSFWKPICYGTFKLLGKGNERVGEYSRFSLALALLASLAELVSS